MTIHSASYNERDAIISDASHLDSELNTEKRGGRIAGFFHKYRAKLALGATALSVGATVALDPLNDTMHKLERAAPYMVTGVAASEAMFAAGGLMMLSAVGSKLKNPFKFKERIPEISQKANSSLLFKSGFWINTTGAVGDFVAVAPAVVTQLPPQSWGVLTLSLADLGVTYAVRKSIWGGMKENGQTITATLKETAESDSIDIAED